MHSNRVQQFFNTDEFGSGAKPRASACCEMPAVFVVDGDASAGQSLGAIIRSAGWEVQVFATAAAFLSCSRALAPSCLVLDIALPDSCGLELQERLNCNERSLSMIFIMEHPDVPRTVRAMRGGAIEVLTRPIEGGALLCALEEAIGRSRATLDQHSSMLALREDYSSLSKREREVMTLVVSGLMNKQVGGELGISEITVKAHRGQAMRKMKARSFADLVHKATQLTQCPN